MKTKLVYVLTCAPEANYIEQALMSVWSARHWNLDAHIVLITDNLTDQLFVGKRAEILDYISEKIVVPFEDDSLSMMYRSRWIKTSVRKLISGDFLFIDCDTIVCRSLAEIDTLDCEVGAVYESHLSIKDWDDGLLLVSNDRCLQLGLDLNKEPAYFSSGVLLVKDTLRSYEMYDLWHQYWLESVRKGSGIDQPALAKANQVIGYLIQQIPDTYNCILFTRCQFYRSAYILHITVFENPSWLFNSQCLAYVRRYGLSRWTKKSISHPFTTFFPFDWNLLHATFLQRLYWILEVSIGLRRYGRYVDSNYQDIIITTQRKQIVQKLLRFRLTVCAMLLWLYYNYKRVKNSKTILCDNRYKKQKD